MVERRHSVRAVPVQIPGSDLGFFQLRINVSLFLLDVKHFLIMCNRKVHTVPYSLLFPIIISNCKNLSNEI